MTSDTILDQNQVYDPASRAPERPYLILEATVSPVPGTTAFWATAAAAAPVPQGTPAAVPDGVTESEAGVAGVKIHILPRNIGNNQYAILITAYWKLINYSHNYIDTINNGC